MLRIVNEIRISGNSFCAVAHYSRQLELRQEQESVSTLVFLKDKELSLLECYTKTVEVIFCLTGEHYLPWSWIIASYYVALVSVGSGRK